MFGVIYFSFLLILTFFGFYYNKTYYDHYREHAQETLSTIADLKVYSILEWKNARYSDIEAIQREPEIPTLLNQITESKDKEASKKDILIHLSQMPFMSQYEMFVFDRNETVVFDFHLTDSEIPQVVKQKIKEVIQTKKIALVDLYRNDVSKKIYMGLMAPLFKNSSEQEISGFIFLRIDPTLYLYPFLQKWPNDNKTAETLLVRKEGDRVLFVNDVKFSNNSALNKSIPLTDKNIPAVQAVLGRIGYFEGTDYMDTPVVAELRAIPNSPWYLVTKINKAEIFASLYVKSKQLFYFLILIALLFAFVLFWFYRNLWILFKIEQNRVTKKNLEYEENIRQANEKANTYFSLVASIIVVIEKDCKVSMINEAGCKLLGYPKEEIIGKNWFDTFLVQDEIKIVKETFAKILVGVIENVEYFENKVISKTGEIKDIAWHNNLLRDKEGNVTGTVSSGEDVTERKLAVEALKKLNEELDEKVNQRTLELKTANKELEAFAYSVSHDLRAPLRSIDGYSHMLLDEYGTTLDEEGKRLLTIIRKSSHTMDQLIFDLLTMAKVTRTQIKIEKINMQNLALSVYEELVAQSDQEKINFTVKTLPYCFGDSTLIHQVWANLILNAVKYTSKKTNRTIVVNGEREKDRIVYSVSDNGVGFNPNYKDKLFGAFQRLHSSTEFEGTGIGLTIVERIITRHGGTVWGVGEEGVGATFYFSLPNMRN